MVDVLNYIYDEKSITYSVRDFAKTKWLAAKRRHNFLDRADDMGSTIDSYDEDFKISFIGEKVDISPEALGKAKTSDSKIVNHIFRCLLNCSGNLVVPDCCAGPKVMERACSYRLAEDPSRIFILSSLNAVVTPEGDIDWSAGQYGMKREGGSNVKLLVHRATGDSVEVDSEYHIGAGWTFCNNHDDQITQLWRTPAQNYTCKRFFGGGKGPNKIKRMKGQDQHWAQLTEEAASSVMKSREAPMMAKNEKEKFETPAKEQRKVTTARAREALKRKAADVDARIRCVKID